MSHSTHNRSFRGQHGVQSNGKKHNWPSDWWQCVSNVTGRLGMCIENASVQVRCLHINVTCFTSRTVKPYIYTITDDYYSYHTKQLEVKKLKSIWRMNNPFLWIASWLANALKMWYDCTINKVNKISRYNDICCFYIDSYLSSDAWHTFHIQSIQLR